MVSKIAQSTFTRTSDKFAKYPCNFQYESKNGTAVILVWKHWAVYARMFAFTIILSCVIINLLNGSIFKMSNLKLSQPACADCLNDLSGIKIYFLFL